MNVLIYNFDAVNPLAHEWAHILVGYKASITLVNHRESIECSHEQIEVHSVDSFQSSDIVKYDFIFLPWIPSRKQILRFLFNWLRLGFPFIFWIDHNPIQGRDKQGIVLKFLRSTKYKKVHRIIHGPNSFQAINDVEIHLPHPIYLNAFENKSNQKIENAKEGITFAFIGRLDSQKGLESLPKLAKLISQDIEIDSNWILAGNNQNMNQVFEIIELMRTIPRVSVEAYVYGKKCPDLYIEYALSVSDFLIAPYKLLTASGTISLAIAMDTEVVSLSKVIPIGLESFQNNLLHCIDEQNLVTFIKERVGEHKHRVTIDPSELKRKKENHNLLCGRNLLSIVEISKRSSKDPLEGKF